MRTAMLQERFADPALLYRPGAVVITGMMDEVMQVFTQQLIDIRVT